MKRENPMEAKRKHIIYKEEFRRQAVGMVIHSGKTQAQVARELGCSEYSLNLWKKAYWRQHAPAQIDGQQRSPQQLFAEIRRLQKQNEYLKGQREILKKAMSILGEEPNPGRR
jgi:transposase